MSPEKFQAIFSRFRDVPKVYDAETLKIPPEDQWVKEIIVSFGSFSNSELVKFLKLATGDTIRGNINDRVLVARELTMEVFGAIPDGTGGYFCEIEFTT